MVAISYQRYWAFVKVFGGLSVGLIFMYYRQKKADTFILHLVTVNTDDDAQDSTFLKELHSNTSTYSSTHSSLSTSSASTSSLFSLKIPKEKPISKLLRMLSSTGSSNWQSQRQSGRETPLVCDDGRHAGKSSGPWAHRGPTWNLLAVLLKAEAG